MAINVRILGWSAEGLRCPDHEVFFQGKDGRCPPVTLLQMPNGTGKTTTLELLRACLSGDAERMPWTKDKILTYRKKNGTSDRGTFQVQVMYGDKKHTFAMTLLFDEGRITYATTLPSGRDEGFKPPKELHQNFFNPDFINFLVFDGELAHQFLSEKHTNAQAAIEELFHLRLFEKMSPLLHNFWARAVAGRTAKGDEKGLVRRQNRVADLSKYLKERREEKASLEARVREVNSKLSNLRGRFNKDLAKKEKDREALNACTAEVARAEEVLIGAGNQTLSYIRNPLGLSHHFAASLQRFKGALDKAKLPESVAKEFFTEVAAEPKCICGRDLDVSTRKELLLRSHQYFGTEDVSLLNTMKSDIGKFVGQAPDECEKELEKYSTGLIKAADTLLVAKTEKESIQQQIIGGDPKLEQARQAITGLETELRQLEEQVDAYESSDNSLGDDRTLSIKILERRLRDAEEKLAEITQTRELKHKLDKLEVIFGEALSIARASIGARICNETNDLIRRVMPNNNIRVAGLDKCLRLDGQRGGSVGETLSVGYSFLAALFAQGGHELPFVVDSPANPIDIAVRKKVAELIPQLTKQFIAFTISTERQAFLEPLEAILGDKIQYLTLFKNTDAKLTVEARRSSGVVESIDGVLVENRDFFRNFHVEDEGEIPFTSG